MSVIAEVEQLALSLTDNERAQLADKLIASLPDDFIDEAEIEEALQRSREMDEEPSRIITLEQLDGMIADRPRHR
ncbi:MAG: addiction module protein [Chloracidobacterium sp.]|nr:addiction module protein [Chloracidobacterium sp.]